MNKIFTLILLVASISISAQTSLTYFPSVNGNITDIDKLGNTLYIAGQFDSVGGVYRTGLAAIDCITGTVASFNPVFSHPVKQIAIAGGKLIATGTFDTVNAQPRAGFCMFDLATGNLDPWDPAGLADPAYHAVTAHNSKFYFLGFSSTFGYDKIICLDAATGNVDWKSVDSTAAGAYTIAVAGNFVWFGAFTIRRCGLLYGSANQFYYSVTDPIHTMVGAGDTLYVGGNFTTIGGQSRNGLVAIDQGGSILPFTISSSDHDVHALFPDGDYLWVGGNSTTYGGEVKNGMAQFQVDSQMVTCWNHVNTGSLAVTHSIFVANDTVYRGTDRLDVLKGTCLGTGITENRTNTSIKFFPNPATDLISIQSSHEAILSVGIYSPEGKLVQKEIMNGNVFFTNIHTQDLTPGMYFIRCESKSGERVLKFLKN